MLIINLSKHGSFPITKIYVIAWNFQFKKDLGQKYYAPQVQPNRGSNNWFKLITPRS